MAPTKPKTKSKKDRAKDRLRAPTQTPTVNARELLAKATALLEAGDPESAAKTARVAYESIGEKGRQAGAALTILGQIQVELGDIDEARTFFAAAVAVDEDGLLPEDVGGGPEKFLWLAQLSEEGGRDSVTWYERGAAALRAEIQTLTDKLASLPRTRDEQEAAISEKRRKLAETLCAVAEVYMTDLSWEGDAEQRCEALITEATMLAPEVAETWQTVASVRISQTRTEEAREALKRSLGLWVNLSPEDPAIPPFPTRVSLVRLLTEVEMLDDALDVAERLVDEDDQSVEAWYLGGFGKYLLGEKLKEKSKPSEAENWQKIWRSSRKWLVQCLAIYDAEEYEDERLKEHTMELLESLKNELGEIAEGDAEIWEDTDDDDDDDSDEEMQ
jgi:tetratricopeptide (TPR) repeat protein